MLSPLDTAYNRLDEAHRAWHGALEGYHRIEDFRANINTAIQALRNITFVLQSQKDILPGFEEWYADWQVKMSKDLIFKEFNNARVTIVHQEDLKLKSTAFAKVKGWFDYRNTAFEFDPLIDSYTIATGFYDTYARYLPIPDQAKKRLVFEFERNWVYEKLPDYELLEAVSKVYRFLFVMIKDVEDKFSLPTRENMSTGTYCESNLNDNGVLRCMIVSPQDRSLVFSFDNGKLLNMQMGNIKRDEVDLQKVQEKYGDDWKSEETISLLDGFFLNEYPFSQMKLFTQAAIGNLKKDKHLIPTSFIFEGHNETPMIISHNFQNQEQKIMTMDKIAGEILKNNAKYVLVLAEVWHYKFDKENPKIPSHGDIKNTTEFLQASCISAEKITTISIPFHKNILGNIVFSKGMLEELSVDDNTYHILIPIINALKQNALNKKSK